MDTKDEAKEELKQDSPENEKIKFTVRDYSGAL